MKRKAKPAEPKNNVRKVSRKINVPKTSSIPSSSPPVQVQRDFGLDYARLQSSLTSQTDGDECVMRVLPTNQLALANIVAHQTPAVEEGFTIPLDHAREYVRRLTALLDAAEQAGLDVG